MQLLKQLATVTPNTDLLQSFTHLQSVLWSLSVHHMASVCNWRYLCVCVCVSISCSSVCEPYWSLNSTAIELMGLVFVVLLSSQVGEVGVCSGYGFPSVREQCTTLSFCFSLFFMRSLARSASPRRQSSRLPCVTTLRRYECVR